MAASAFFQPWLTHHASLPLPQVSAKANKSAGYTSIPCPAKTNSVRSSAIKEILHNPCKTVRRNAKRTPPQSKLSLTITRKGQRHPSITRQPGWFQPTHPRQHPGSQDTAGGRQSPQPTLTCTEQASGEKQPSPLPAQSCITLRCETQKHFLFCVTLVLMGKHPTCPDLQVEENIQ